MTPVSRNAPCPCGSGKKYKNCCGTLATDGRDSSAASYPMYPGWDRLPHDECLSLWQMMQTALDALKRGNHDQAKNLFETVTERAPGTFDALHMLGVIEMEFGNLELAEELITRAAKWLSTPAMASNLALLRNRRRDQEGMYSLRSIVAAEAIALFASQTPDLKATGKPDSLLLRPDAVPGAALHVVVPGDVLSLGSNHTAQRLHDRYVKAGLSVTLWRTPREGIPTMPLDGVRDIDSSEDQVPGGGMLAIVGLDSSMLAWLPRHAGGFEEIYVLVDVEAPQALSELIGRLPSESHPRLRLVVRSASVLAQWGLSGIVDPFLLGGPAAPARRAVAGVRPRIGVFILPRGGQKDRDRWAMLTWLRGQGAFIRILYPGRLPSRHIANDEEHLVSLATDWHDEWCADLDALFFWGAEGRAHQFDSLLAEARAAGLSVITDGYAETAGSDARDEVFFTTDEARAALVKLVHELRA